MGWNDYQKQLKRHPRYQEQRLPVGAVPLRVWQRRALWLGLANVIPLAGAAVLDWGLSGVLWVYWGEALGLTAWMVLKAGLARRGVLAGASVLLLGYMASQLVGLSQVEARTYDLLPAHHLAAGMAAALVGIAFLVPAHALPPVARTTSVWPQLALVHAFIVVGGGFALLTEETVGIAFVLAVSKAIGQVSLATWREMHNLQRVRVGSASSAVPRAPARPAAVAASSPKASGGPVMGTAPTPWQAPASPAAAEPPAAAPTGKDASPVPEQGNPPAAAGGVAFQRAQ